MPTSYKHLQAHLKLFHTFYRCMALLVQNTDLNLFKAYMFKVQGLFVTCIVQNSALRPTNSTCTVTHSHTSYFHIFNAADCLWHFTATMCTTAAVVDCNLSMYDSQAALFIYLFYSYLALVHYYT